jgi:hypothetical protein
MLSWMAYVAGIWRVSVEGGRHNLAREEDFHIIVFGWLVEIMGNGWKWEGKYEFDCGEKRERMNGVRMRLVSLVGVSDLSNRTWQRRHFSFLYDTHYLPTTTIQSAAAALIFDDGLVTEVRASFLYLSSTVIRDNLRCPCAGCVTTWTGGCCSSVACAMGVTPNRAERARVTAPSLL